MRARPVQEPADLSRARLARGYTLVEVIVAVGLFALLVTGLANIFGTVVRGQKSSLGQTTLIGDVQRFFEVLEREVRTAYGSEFRCASGDPIISDVRCEGSTLVLTNQHSEAIEYALTGTGAIQRDGGSGGSMVLTSPAVEVTNLTFSVIQSGLGSAATGTEPALLGGRQGQVTVRLRVCPRGVNDKRCFAAQTTLTSRQQGFAP